MSKACQCSYRTIIICKGTFTDELASERRKNCGQKLTRSLAGSTVKSMVQNETDTRWLFLKHKKGKFWWEEHFQERLQKHFFT